MTRQEYIRQLEVARFSLNDPNGWAALYSNISLLRLMTDEEWDDAEFAARDAVGSIFTISGTDDPA